MLVPGLQNELLFKMTSGSDAILSHIHKSLSRCAQEMLDKYRKQLMSTRKKGKTERLEIKARATETLLKALSKMPKNSDTIRETIASALEHHAKALQGHEHLLSRKGNTYALMQQTKGLRRRHDAPASLLQYHDLKDKLLGDDSPLKPEIKELTSMVAQSKTLKLQTLVALDEQHRPEETGRLFYTYDNRNFPLQGSSSRELPENFICCICQNIINQPREVCSQSHLTCLECAIKLKERKNASCPQCRNTLTEFRENIAIERSIGSLQVRCCNAGCRSIIEISEIKSHLDLCKEEKIECPGKCTDESTDEVLRIQRKRLTDHSKECSKHFKCDNCAERFPCNTETRYLKQLQIHMRSHGTDQNALSGFVTSIADELLLLREQAQKEITPQTKPAKFNIPSNTEFQTPSNSSSDYSSFEVSRYRFANTDCVSTPQDGVYKSLENPCHFFIVMKPFPAFLHFQYGVMLHVQKYIEAYRENINLTLNIIFTVNAIRDQARTLSWKVCIPEASEIHGSRAYVNVTGYSGVNHEVNETKLLIPPMEWTFHIKPGRNNSYLFKIAV